MKYIVLKYLPFQSAPGAGVPASAGGVIGVPSGFNM